jgi:hypothetical protein
VPLIRRQLRERELRVLRQCEFVSFFKVFFKT